MLTFNDQGRLPRLATRKQLYPICQSLDYLKITVPTLI